MLNFTYMKSIQYRYRFQHGERQWVNNGLNNSISLARLNPGKYTLEVQGSLDGNEWSASAFLSFKVNKPWWASWWAIAIFTLVIGIPVILILRNKMLLDREKHENEVLKLESEHKAALMETKDRILSNVAHDLKTPLTIITGLAEKIGKDSDEKIMKVSNTIKQQSGELLDMISQILNLGRLRELGDIPLSPRPVVLEDFINALVNLATEQAAEKNIAIHKRLPDCLPEIFIDEIGLKTILGNLLSNAVKFTPNGGNVVIKVSLDEENLEVFVCDSGPGIPEDKAQFLFQRFYQVDGEKYPGGSGIGLAYASEMAKLMGGDLSWIPSERGAAFRVSFPMDMLELPETGSFSGSKGEDPEQYRASENAGQRPLILVVEDQTNMAAYIKSILEADFEVLIAYDGRSGLEKTIHYIPDLVISDVVLPGLSGLEMCRAIQEDMRTSHIPVIILSGKSSSGSIRAGLASGAGLYLTKPFDPEVLKQYVSNSLQFVAQTKRYFKSFWEEGRNMEDSRAELPEGVNTGKEDFFIKQVEAIIKEYYSDEDFTVDKMANLLHVSQSQLRRKIYALGGESAGIMLRKYRLNKAKEVLKSNPDASISEIAYLCGFADPNYFSSAFGKEFGMTPRQFRNYSLNR
jgi:signal transduction histidine kinase/CheY-like chemotaxis protein/AraC-like DNA-binding protein